MLGELDESGNMYGVKECRSTLIVSPATSDTFVWLGETSHHSILEVADAFM